MRDETRAGATRVGRPVWILIATSLGVMMDGIDTTGVAVANPAIIRDLHTDLAAIQWITNGYILAMAVSLITAGKLGDRFGHKRVFLLALLGFAISSALVGSATSAESMITWRVAQGMFGAALLPNSLAILRLAFPRDKLKMAIGFWGGMIALSTAIGPAAGGLIVDLLGWRWVFFVNLFITAAAIAIGLRTIPDRRVAAARQPLDLPGVGLLTGGLGAAVWGVIRAPGDGWASPAVLLAFACAATCLVLFLVRESRAREPLLPLDLFRSVPLSAATVSIMLAGLAMFGVLFYLALYLQQVRGLGPSQAGLSLMPVTALFIVGAPLGGFLNQRFGPRLPLVGGLLLAAGSLIGLSRIGVDSPVSTIWPYLLPLGMGMGLAMPTATEVVISNAPSRLAGVASGLTQTAGMLGTVLGTAGFGYLLSHRIHAVLPERLAAAGVPASVGDPVRAQVDQLATGVVPVPTGTTEAMARVVVEASHAAFAAGLRFTVLVGVAITVVGALCALLVERGDSPVDPAAAPEPETASGLPG